MKVPTIWTFSEAIIPVDDARLATGVRARVSRIIVPFSDGGNGNNFDKWRLVLETSYQRDVRRRGFGRGPTRDVLSKIEWSGRGQVFCTQRSDGKRGLEEVVTSAGCRRQRRVGPKEGPLRDPAVSCGEGSRKRRENLVAPPEIGEANGFGQRQECFFFFFFPS
jgi:hypothetical protein